MAKKRLLTAGGLGDAAMSYAKIFSTHAPFHISDCPNIEVTHITHIRGKGEFATAIKDFYTSQGIKATIKFRKKVAEQVVDREDFDHYLGTHWFAKNVGDEESWEINPNPPLTYESVTCPKTLISPVAGVFGNRGFSLDMLALIDAEDIGYVGKIKNENGYFDKFKGENYINKTTMEEFVNLICSCETFIGQSGFSALLAAMAGKKVYMVSEGQPTLNRVHPDWDVTYIESISDYLTKINAIPQA